MCGNSGVRRNFLPKGVRSNEQLDWAWHEENIMKGKKVLLEKFLLRPNRFLSFKMGSKKTSFSCSVTFIKSLRPNLRANNDFRALKISMLLSKPYSGDIFISSGRFFLS